MIKNIAGLFIGIGLLVIFFAMPDLSISSPGVSILSLIIGGTGAFLSARSIRNIILKK